MKQWKMKSPLGPLYLIANDVALIGVNFEKQDIPMIKDSSLHPILKQAHFELEEYFTGKRKNFDVPLDAQGTAFQQKVWKALTGIPYGKTCSYKDIAKKIKNDKAVRAVGTANGRNPLCVIIPCHRVIAADGTLGGYTGGLHIKVKLLNLEKDPA